MQSQSLLRHLIAETVLGYIFWSLFCGLFPMIWFYPLNELDFTGYEVFFGVLLVPILCEINLFTSLIKSEWGLSALRVTSLLSIASFQAPTTYSRLVILSIGTASAILVLISTLWSNSPVQRCFSFWGLIAGYFAMLTGRIWYTSLLPTWTDVFSNNVVLTFGTIATLDRIFLSGFSHKGKQEKRKNEKVNSKNSVKVSWFKSGLGFGSLLYVTVAIFGEVSVVSRWVVSGFPKHGPNPNPWGAHVLACILIGILLSFAFSNICYSKIWFLLGCAGMSSLYLLPTFAAYAGGLILAVYVMSIWPELTRQIISCPPGRSLTVAMATFIIEMLFSIWTTAYNFVPGGEYTREHTGYLLFFIMFVWGVNLCFLDDKSKLLKNHFAFTHFGKEKICGTKLSFILILLLSVGVGGFVYRSRPSVYEFKPEKIKERQISALIWTFHFGYDNEGWPSLERAAKLLNDTGADVVTLLESDASKPYLGNNDLAMWMSEKLKMNVDFGPSTRDHTWGNLILSKYPIVKSQHHLLPSPFGELAPAISATVNVSGELINFVTSHMGNDRDTLDRKLQAEYLSNLTAKSENPVIFLGYVTSSPGSRDYQVFTSKGRLKDIDDTDRDRWCEYIMYRGLKRLGYARISHGGLSDTELQMAKFEIPKKGENWSDNEKIEIDVSKVPSSQRFNSKFGDFRHGHNWARIHQFHASTPKYFLPLKKNS